MKNKNILAGIFILAYIICTVSCGKKESPFALKSDNAIEKEIIGDWISPIDENSITIALTFGKKGKLTGKMYYKDAEKTVYEKLEGTWNIKRKELSPYAEKIAIKCNIPWIKNRLPYVTISFKNITRKETDAALQECSFLITDNAKQGKERKTMLCILDVNMEELSFMQKNPESEGAGKLEHQFYHLENLCEEKNAFIKQKYTVKEAKEITAERFKEIELENEAIDYSGSWLSGERFFNNFDQWELSMDKTFSHSWANSISESVKKETGTWEVMEQDFTNAISRYYIMLYNEDNAPYKCLARKTEKKSAIVIDAKDMNKENFEKAYQASHSRKDLIQEY